MIWLVGMTGVGKTTVGRMLAEMLDVPFHDVDRMVEEGAGESIADIWTTSGERRFRELELVAVEELEDVDRGVVALGAGALATPGVFSVLSEEKSVVELWADVPDLIDRLGDVSKRPALADDGVAGLGERLEEMAKARLPRYHAVATLRVDTTARSPEEICGQIIQELGF